MRLHRIDDSFPPRARLTDEDRALVRGLSDRQLVARVAEWSVAVLFGDWGGPLPRHTREYTRALAWHGVVEWHRREGRRHE